MFVLNFVWQTVMEVAREERHVWWFESAFQAKLVLVIWEDLSSRNSLGIVDKITDSGKAMKYDMRIILYM